MEVGSAFLTQPSTPKTLGPGQAAQCSGLKKELQRVWLLLSPMTQDEGGDGLFQSMGRSEADILYSEHLANVSRWHFNSRVPVAGVAQPLPPSFASTRSESSTWWPCLRIWPWSSIAVLSGSSNLILKKKKNQNSSNLLPRVSSKNLTQWLRWDH